MPSRFGFHGARADSGPESERQYGKGDVMAQQEKCAHPACSCSVVPNGPFGKYCSEHCKKAAGMTELRCGCNHADCGR